MINVQTKLFRYKLPLKKAINKSGTVTFREGLILALCNNNEILSLGEIAPLPGFSRETIDQAEEQIVQSLKRIPLDTVISGLQNSPLIETMLEHAKDARLHPSVEFGLCTAILNLMSKIKVEPVRKILSMDASDAIDINALIAGSYDEIFEMIENKISRGFKTFKLKVGRQSLEDDVKLVLKINEIIKKPTSLVLDANRAWGVEEAISFSEQISDIKIMYIEEPVKDYLGILQLCNKSKFKVPIALDESLNTISHESLEPIPSVTTLILKPTILGFVKTIEFNKKAESLGMKTVISSSFESSIGLSALAEIASGLNAKAGLDTIEWFTEDTLKSPLEIKSGRIDFTTFVNPKLNLESSCIEEIILV